MYLKNILLTSICLFGLFSSGYASVPDPKGRWKFDDPANLLKAEAGTTGSLEIAGTMSASSGPEQGNGALSIGMGSFLRMRHQIAANGGGTKVNEYSLLFDFKIKDLINWHCFFQTDTTNKSDGDFFINTSGGIGVAAVGYSGAAVAPQQWYRLIVSVKNGSFFTCYLDGVKLMDGAVQPVDGRFSLDSLLLLFADENGEDDEISVADLSIWDQALNADQVAELGGFGHVYIPFELNMVPYLQAPGRRSMVICWHDTTAGTGSVEYGTDSNLTFSKSGTAEWIKIPYKWNTVQLSGLNPDTRYFYRIRNVDSVSRIYSFRTLPDTLSEKKCRFIIFGDTHSSDSTWPLKVLRASREKVLQQYGPDLENQVTTVFHTGDLVVSGDVIEQYSSEYFYPMSVLSGHIPFMTEIGNHEGESQLYYQYMKYDSLSAFPSNPALNEKVWSLRVEDALFIGLNTNITSQYGNLMAVWLDSKLKAAEKDTSIDFVFIFFHHPPYSELWQVVTTFDGGPNYVLNRLIPICKRYTKVQEMHYGHTHGFERGTITSSTTDGDFRIICGGGSGGPLDPWGPGLNRDYPDIHKTYSTFMYQILEIDPSQRSFRNEMYSLGTPSKPENNVLLDSWYRKKNQPGPAKPSLTGAEVMNDFVQCHSSAFSGVDSLMSVQLQVIDSLSIPAVLVDTMLHWTDVYGVNASGVPVDLNKNLDLYNVKLPMGLMSGHPRCALRVRYRDHNLKWSQWSDLFYFFTTENQSLYTEDRGQMISSFPNPCNGSTTLQYFLPESQSVNVQLFDSSSRLMKEFFSGYQEKGEHLLLIQTAGLREGMYLLKLNTPKGSLIGKFVKNP